MNFEALTPWSTHWPIGLAYVPVFTFAEDGVRVGFCFYCKTLSVLVYTVRKLYQVVVSDFQTLPHQHISGGDMLSLLQCSFLKGTTLYPSIYPPVSS